jgi:uncharacterized protein
MIREPFHFRETFATILADDSAHVAAAKSGMMAARQVLEAYIARDPFFAATFDPYDPDSDEPIITRMASAARCAGVGPMAAVAGTIAGAGVESMLGAGATFGVIDNGGDIALVADRPVRVGVHAGGAALSNRVAFVVPPQEKILGICTSSATMPLRFFLMMWPFPMHGQLRSATRSGRMTIRSWRRLIHWRFPGYLQLWGM